jgi:hypothetical protein
VSEREQPDLGQFIARQMASPEGADAPAAQRVLARLSALPPQRRSFFRWPRALLGLDFAPAWPRVGALAAVALSGIVIGLLGPDVSVDAAGASPATDLQSVVFEPEPLTGVGS